MQNLEQIRARNALKCAENGTFMGKNGGEVIKKIPPLILNHGLLATMAYSFRDEDSTNGESENSSKDKEQKGKGWREAFDAIARHLADKDVAVVPGSVKDRKSLMDYLTAPSTTSETLKLATAETMAWLNYARRFVKKEKEQS